MNESQKTHVVHTLSDKAFKSTIVNPVAVLHENTIA